MDVRETVLPGVLIIELRVFDDSRGFFMETFQRDRYAQCPGLASQYVQDNFSQSQRGTLRGLHYQIQHAQGKLVQVVRGHIFDVAVDLRRDSLCFGKWVGAELSESNRHQLYVPPGFAHGFYVLSEVADVFYKCTDYYSQPDERTLIWNDLEIGIEWPLNGEPILSEKDRSGLRLADAECYRSISDPQLQL